MKETKSTFEIATEIIESLLTNANGNVGTRLAIKQKAEGAENDLGGWGKNPAIEQATLILKRYIP